MNNNTRKVLRNITIFLLILSGILRLFVSLSRTPYDYDRSALVAMQQNILSGITVRTSYSYHEVNRTEITSATPTGLTRLTVHTEIFNYIKKISASFFSKLKKQEYCENLQVFGDNLFVVMKDVVVDRSFSQGKRGGETIKDVMNQNLESEYYKVSKGFFKVICPGFSDARKKLNVKSWKHHFKDWLQSIQSFETQSELDSKTANGTQKEEKLTIAVVRYEYANLYHTMTDWYSAFYVMTMLNKSPSEIKILIVDGHAQGKMDDTWGVLFSSAERIGHQKLNQTKYSQLAWSVVGYESTMYTSIQKKGPAPELLPEFLDFFLQAYGLSRDHKPNLQKLNILFLWRRDYLAHPRQTSSFKKTNATIVRKIFNEAELFNAVTKSFPQHNVSQSQLDLLPMKQQLKKIVNTDILISMHGGGLSHILFMPTTSGLIEFFPRYTPYRPHFEIFARWREQSYLKWSNRDISNEMSNFRTKIPVNVLLDMVGKMIKMLAAKK